MVRMSAVRPTEPLFEPWLRSTDVRQLSACCTPGVNFVSHSKIDSGSQPRVRFPIEDVIGAKTQRKL
jgi:hypothetical protein